MFIWVWCSALWVSELMYEWMGWWIIKLYMNRDFTDYVKCMKRKGFPPLHLLCGRGKRIWNPQTMWMLYFAAVNLLESFACIPHLCCCCCCWQGKASDDEEEVVADGEPGDFSPHVLNPQTYGRSGGRCYLFVWVFDPGTAEQQPEQQHHHHRQWMVVRNGCFQSLTHSGYFELDGGSEGHSNGISVCFRRTLHLIQCALLGYITS